MCSDKPGQVAVQDKVSNVTIVGRALFSVDDIQTEGSFDSCKAAAQNGDALAQFRLSQLYIQGEEVTRHSKNSFKWLLKAACSGEKQAYRELSAYFDKGCGTKKNLHEAYIWALISNTTKKFKISAEQLKALEDALSQTDREDAEDEATRRHKLLKQGKYKDEHFIPFEPLPALATVESTAKDIFSELKKWQIPEPKELTITLNYNDKNKTAVFRYMGKALSYPLKDVFSATFQSLLVKHHRAQKLGTAAITYKGHDVSQKGKNQNHYYVDHFNSHLRKLLGVGKDFQPFEWIGLRKDANKGLKARFTLVVYEPDNL